MENMNVSNQGAIHRKEDIATWMGSAHYPAGRDFLCIYSHVKALLPLIQGTEGIY